MDSRGIFDKLESHAAALGIFEQVNKFEPKSSPGNGLTASVWLQSVGPARGSGLVATDALLVFMVRIYSNPFAGELELLDPNALDAVDALMTVYSGDFTLGGAVREVDLLGRTGSSLGMQAGYVRLENTVFRVMTITVPLIVSDAWEQAA